MSHWSLEQLSRLDGKTVLVTGANSGLGLASAKALARLGAHLVVTCRGEEKGKQACQDILDAVPNAKAQPLDMDLADLNSVRSAAAEFLRQHDSLDLLINNAGVMGLPKSVTSDGFEKVFAVNHLGPFLFTGLLLPALEAAPAARIVTVTSVTSRKGKLPMDDLHWERRRYNSAQAYAQSKLANLSFALELEKRLRAKGMKSRSVAVHPGYAATNVVFARDAQRDFGRRLWEKAAQMGNWLIAQPADKGAWPSLYAAAMVGVQGGEYFGPRGFMEFRGAPGPVFVNPLARECGSELWAQSESLTGICYP